MRSPTRVLILGAAGRDFHNFNVVYRDDPATEVVAFTAAQIPGTAGRRYPPVLAGPRYPSGIPIEPEEAFETLVRENSGLRCVQTTTPEAEHGHGPRGEFVRALAPTQSVIDSHAACGFVRRR